MSDQNQYAPNYAVAPGDIIEEHREAAAMTQAELGKRLALSVKHVNRMIAGEEPITPETALKLESVFGLPAHVWLGLEARYREFKAREADSEALQSEAEWLERIPYKSMVKLQWLTATRDKLSQVRALREFYQVGSLNSLPDVWSKVNAAYRKAPAYASQEWALVAWLTEGERRANVMQCQPFDAADLRAALPALKAMSRLSGVDFVEPLIKQCASLGIALVFVPTPDGARVCGATRWLTSDKVLVQLSLRYKTDDQLWFTLFHEFGHVLLHGKNGEYIDFEKAGDKSELEQQADAFAVESLLEQKALQVFVTSGELSAIRIEAFAKQQNVAPGIVLGQLQHQRLIPYATKLNSLKGRFVWSHEQTQS